MPPYNRLNLNGDAIYKSIPDGEEGVNQTLNEMYRLIKSGAKDPLIIETTRKVVSGIPERQYKDEINAIFRFVQNRVRFTKDVVGVETLTTPQRMIKEIKEQGFTFGDCDCKSTLLGAMLESIGHPVKLVVTSQSPDKEYQHVYVETEVGGEIIPLDASTKNTMGWEQPFYTAKKRYSFSGDIEERDNPRLLVLIIIGLFAGAYYLAKEK